TLQPRGAGTYIDTTQFDAWTDTCSTTFSNLCNTYGCALPPAWTVDLSWPIARPGRPDYSPGSPAVYYLNGEMTSGNYTAQTSLTPLSSMARRKHRNGDLLLVTTMALLVAQPPALKTHLPPPDHPPVVGTIR